MYIIHAAVRWTHDVGKASALHHTCHATAALATLAEIAEQ